MALAFGSDLARRFSAGELVAAVCPDNHGKPSWMFDVKFIAEGSVAKLTFAGKFS